MADLPIVMTPAGPQVQPPATLRQRVLDLAQTSSPGLTADLPGVLVEDILGTDVGALTVADQSAVELVNSVSPLTANAYLLPLIGQVYGVSLGGTTNATVGVVFTQTGATGYVVPPGFVVSDGTYQYVVQDGGPVGPTGVTATLTATAILSGTWSIPAGTVTELVTQPPPTITLSVTNPLAGVPGQDAEDLTQYRGEVLQAGLASAQGMARMLKTQLRNVPGVQPRLVSVRQQTATPGVGGWEVIVGGGDEYAVASAIFAGVGDVSNLVGSVMTVTNITSAADATITTLLNHGLTSGQVVTVENVGGMVQINGVPLTVAVVDEKSFTTGVDTTTFYPYTSGGYVTTNPRNVTVYLNDYPDTYAVPFVVPPQQLVTIVATWNTSVANFVSSAAVASLAAAALVTYVNGIYVGQPLNLLDMGDAFRDAVVSVLPGPLVTRLVFTVSINGVSATPGAGTQIIDGDPESYFYASVSSVSVVQG